MKHHSGMVFFSIFCILCLQSWPAEFGGMPWNWPEKLNTPTQFDRASRAAILSASEILSFLTDTLLIDSVRLLTAVKNPHISSIEKMLVRQRNELLQGYAAACKGTALNSFLVVDKTDDFKTFAACAKTAIDTLPMEYAAWRDSVRVFYAKYWREQIRLAALFPATTSEILPLTDNDVLGDKCADKSFFLTFDDGPGGTETRIITDLLRYHHISGIFFVLGTSLNSYSKKWVTDSTLRPDVLYKGMCIGWHGKEHKPFPKLTAWQSALDDADSLLKAAGITTSASSFRPPYGQRTVEISDYLSTKKMPILLWNIDSQDWSSAMSTPRIAGRVLSLMLMRRKGILLFHDIHAKAKHVLPELFSLCDSSGIQWPQCSTLERR